MRSKLSSGDTYLRSLLLVTELLSFVDKRPLANSFGSSCNKTNDIFVDFRNGAVNQKIFRSKNKANAILIWKRHIHQRKDLLNMFILMNFVFLWKYSFIL